MISVFLANANAIGLFAKIQYDDAVYLVLCCVKLIVGERVPAHIFVAFHDFFHNFLFLLLSIY